MSVTRTAKEGYKVQSEAEDKVGSDQRGLRIGDPGCFLILRAVGDVLLLLGV